MMVRNVHERWIAAPPERVADVVETLASADDRLWPHERWVRMKLDSGLEPGSRGGHGPIRYEVARHEPGRLLEFRFPRTGEFRGVHRFEIEPSGSGTLLRHVLEGTTHGRTRLVWPLVILPLHDALLEELLDKAEREATGRTLPLRGFSPRVRVLRMAVGAT